MTEVEQLDHARYLFLTNMKCLKMASWFILYCFYFREKETDNSKTEGVHLAHVATLDHDDLSLVSYNSIRDCSVSATPKTVSLSEPCHVGQLPQAISEELKVNSH